MPAWSAPMIAMALLAAAPAGAGVLADCGESEVLGRDAMAGKLSVTDQGCLELAMEAGVDQVTRERISLILIGNAYATGDRVRWVGLVERHLIEIDGDDPEIAYQYALHLLQREKKPALALEWSEVALQHQYRWDPDDLPTKLYNVVALRARAGKMIMDEARAAYEAAPNPGNRMVLYRAEGKARLHAIAWARKARALGRDSSEAVKFCVATGWPVEECEEAMNRE